MVCVFPLVPLTMGTQEVCQDKAQTAGLSLVRTAKLSGQSLVGRRLKKAEDLWTGVPAQVVFKEKHGRDVPLAGECVATCVFKAWRVRGQSAAGPTTPPSLNL